MNVWIKHSRGILLLLVSLIVIWTNVLCCFGAAEDLPDDLPDNYLGTEFNWAFLLSSPNVDYFMHYPGSKLWPLTKVQVNFRSYKKAQNSIVPTKTVYEDLWYHKQAPIGLERHNKISITPLSDGAIIVCPSDNKDTPNFDPSERAALIADAIVRIIVDIQFRQGLTGLVLVPQEEYDDVAAVLPQYHFLKNSAIKAISIHLRAYPDLTNRDAIFYLQGR